MRWVVLVVLAGCHFGWNTWQGAQPRAANAVKLALYAPDETSNALAHQALARDPHVTVVDVDPALIDKALIDKERTACGSATCPLARETGCAWAYSQGLDYYVTGTVGTRYDAEFVCTKHDSGSLLDVKKDPPCVEGHYTNQRTGASFTLDVYDARTCELAPSLSTRVTTVARGEEDVSKPEALAQIHAEAPAKTVPFPDQISVGANGAIDAGDSYYARYDNGRYRGYVAVEGGRARALHCCEELREGDVLVARGRRRLLEIALNGAVGSLTFDGERRFAGGAGAHVRYYPLDSGLRYGFGADIIGDARDVNVVIVTPEVGWGFRPSSALSLSANVGVGFASGNQVVAGMNGADVSPYAVAPHAMATLRAVTFFATWWYLAGDIGYVYTGTLDDWEGDGASGARPVSVRSPIARVWLGLDL